MVLIFLMTSLLVGSGITLYKRVHPDFAPDLPIAVIRDDQRDTTDFGENDPLVQIEPALHSKGAIHQEGSPVLEEVIQKTEDRLRGEYPEFQININTASKRELMLLPRIGPKTADKIIAFREANGSFQTKEEIMKVKGIGEKTFERLKEMIIVE